MKIKIEVAVFKVKGNGMIFTLNVDEYTDRNTEVYQSNDRSEFIGFQFVEVDV